MSFRHWHRSDRGTHQPVEGLTQRQMEIVSHGLIRALIGHTGDLRLIHPCAEPRRAIREMSPPVRLAQFPEARGDVR